MDYKYVVLIAIYITGVFADNEVPRVKTPRGLVEGLHATSYDGRIFSAFYGIPFAEPPVGKYRFKDPVAKREWIGVWRGNNTYLCTQIMPNIDSFEFMGQEDCLYLNVFVPKEIPNKKDNMDVIVHIHGGAFMMGSQHMLAGPEYLMDRDVIVVTMNYRLGPFGFLSTEDDVVSGNMGLKDQTMALKWIKESIASFGGNPNSVTITGLSAGGASVHYHYLTSLSKGLFHRGMSLSGTVLAPWAFQQRPLENAKKLSINLGCIDDKLDKHIVDMTPIVKCMRQRSSRQILDALVPFYTYKNMPFAPFGPSIEIKSDSAFLIDLPYKLLQKAGAVADLPWITSVVTDEGIFPAAYFSEHLDEIEDRWNEVIPTILAFERSVPKSKMDAVSQKLRDHYLKSKPLTKDNFKEFINMNSDRHFFISAETAAKMQAQINKENVYFYKFAHRGRDSFSSFFGSTENLGVSHGDDAQYIFSNVIMTQKLNDQDTQVKDMLIDMFVKFSKTGEPSIKSIKWPALTRNRFYYLIIEGPEKITVDNMENSEILYPKFWDDLPIEENKKHVFKKNREEL